MFTCFNVHKTHYSSHKIHCCNTFIHSLSACSVSVPVSLKPPSRNYKLWLVSSGSPEHTPTTVYQFCWCYCYHSCAGGTVTVQLWHHNLTFAPAAALKTVFEYRLFRAFWYHLRIYTAQRQPKQGAKRLFKAPPLWLNTSCKLIIAKYQLAQLHKIPSILIIFCRIEKPNKGIRFTFGADILHHLFRV